MTILREPLSGVILPVPTPDAAGSVSRFERLDGSFGFQLVSFAANDFLLADIGPGDILEWSYNYFATASTGFGEIAIFAAIGDPFDLSAGGGRFVLQVGDRIEPGPGPGIPAPGTLALLGLGLFLLSVSSQRAAAADGRLTAVRSPTIFSQKQQQAMTPNRLS